MKTVPHEFLPKDLIAGHIALDFTNTVTARDTTPRDWLDGYTRLIEWAGLAGAIDARTAARLAAAAHETPRQRRGGVALLAGKTPPGPALDEIQTAWKRAAARARVTAQDGLLHVEPDAVASGLDLPLDRVIFAAVDLLGELDADRTRVCRGHDCGWLFIDRSKGGRRVWCDMGTCGNTAKSRRFARARRRQRPMR